MTIDFDGEASTIGVEGEASMNAKSECTRFDGDMHN